MLQEEELFAQTKDHGLFSLTQHRTRNKKNLEKSCYTPKTSPKKTTKHLPPTIITLLEEKIPIFFLNSP